MHPPGLDSNEVLLRLDDDAAGVLARASALGVGHGAAPGLVRIGGVVRLGDLLLWTALSGG